MTESLTASFELNANEAWNDDYEWAYDVTASTRDDWVRVGLYANINGAGWVKHGADILHKVTGTDFRATRTIDGMSTAGPDGDLFGMDIESFAGDGSLDDVRAVRWDRATAPTTVSATPAGADDVVFRVEGGVE